jgi:hypothetical protein
MIRRTLVNELKSCWRYVSVALPTPMRDTVTLVLERRV